MTKSDKERINELEKKFLDNADKMKKIIAEYQKLEVENNKIKQELQDLKQEATDKAQENDQALTAAEAQADEFEAQILIMEKLLKIK
jgi:regulator of replication initiation timing